jgi:hypothetical protein
MWKAEPRWIFLGCLIPDLPWILQRLGSMFIPGLDLYDLRLYAIVQASLAVSLLLCGALAQLSSRASEVFNVLAFNAFLHLLLDACETKWANGVHLFAPFSWTLLNFGWFWPESLLILLLTAFGLVYVVWTLWHTAQRPMLLRWRSPRRLLCATGLLIAYISLPLAFRAAPYAQDNHFVGTLRERQLRVGRPVEFDRNLYLKRPSGDVLRTFAGEELRISSERLGQSEVVSVRATFVDPTTIRIDALHIHWGSGRDIASYLGLVLFAALWMKPYWRLRKRRARLSGRHGRKI